MGLSIRRGSVFLAPRRSPRKGLAVQPPPEQDQPGPEAHLHRGARGRWEQRDDQIQAPCAHQHGIPATGWRPAAATVPATTVQHHTTTTVFTKHLRKSHAYSPCYQPRQGEGNKRPAGRWLRSGRSRGLFRGGGRALLAAGAGRQQASRQHNHDVGESRNDLRVHRVLQTWQLGAANPSGPCGPTVQHGSDSGKRGNRGVCRAAGTAPGSGYPDGHRWDVRDGAVRARPGHAAGSALPGQVRGDGVCCEIGKHGTGGCPAAVPGTRPSSSCTLLSGVLPEPLVKKTAL